jgi:hypothetical protein
MTQQPSQGDYSIYGLAHPHDMFFRYIGLAQDVLERFKQHMQPSQRRPGTKWIDDLEVQGLRPVLVVIETGIQSRPAGLIRERFWMRYYTDLKHPLENVGDNTETQREKQSQALETQTRAQRGLEQTPTQHQGPFAKLPASLWTYSGLSVSERWLCATIMRLCWRPGPQPISYQQLAKETGITVGALCSSNGEQKREGMIPHLEREGLATVYRPVDEEGHVIRGKPFLIEPTDKLWQLNTSSSPHSVYSVNTIQEKETYYIGETVYSVNTVPDVVNTVPHTVNTLSHSVNTKEGLSLDEKRDEQAPIDSIDKEDKRYDSSSSLSEQHTDALVVPTLPLRDEVSVHTSSYSHEPAESEWLCETEGETDIFSEDADPTEKRPVVQGGNLAPGEGRAPLESKDRREGTGKTRAVKPTGSGPPPASPGQAARMREQPTIQSTPHEEPRQPTETPTGDTPDASTLPTKKTDGKGNRKKSEVPLLCEPSTVRKLIDANRGYVLKEKGAIIHQNIVLREWSEQNPLEHYHEVMNHLKTCRCKNPSHEWWHKDEHWHYLDADNLAKLTPGVLSELGLVPKPELPPDIPRPSATPQANGKYHPYTRASMYDPIEIGV